MIKLLVFLFLVYWLMILCEFFLGVILICVNLVLVSMVWMLLIKLVLLM